VNRCGWDEKSSKENDQDEVNETKQESTVIAIHQYSVYVSISEYLSMTYTFWMFQSPSLASEQHLWPVTVTHTHNSVLQHQ